MIYEERPAAALYGIDEEHDASWVVVASTVFFIYSLMGVTAKLLIRFNFTSLKAHDVVLLLGTVLLFGQTVCVISACNAGLGQHQEAIATANFVRYNKFEYAYSMLALAVQASAKVSICLLISVINNQELFNARRVIHGINQGRLLLANRLLLAVVLTWTLSGLVLVAFRCHMPDPWMVSDFDKCPRRGVVYVYNGVMDIMTDLALCVLPIAMMWKVQATFAQKVQVVVPFGTRIIVPLTTIPSLLGSRYFFQESDTTWRAVTPAIWLQVSLNLSILTACIPSLKSFVDSLLGSTMGAAVDAPYQLTDFDESHISKKQERRHRAGQVACSDSPQGEAYQDGRSESRRNLTEGVIFRSREFEVAFEDTSKRASIHGGSQVCSDEDCC